jgi:DNA helicase-2/ATP-dependent DNA helicase PcrA
VRDFERWRAQSRELPHSEVAQIVLEESGYMEMWQKDKSPEAAGRLENLKEFVTALAEFETLDSFLEHVSLVMENQEKDGTDMVSVMTLHSAKGLEFDAVFLPGWEEGVFPNQRTMDESGITGLEEERRLAYVGITRARKQAFIYFAANRQIFGNWQSCLPSRFIDELPKDHVDVLVETGLYQPQRQQQSDWGGGYSGGGGYRPRHRPELIDNAIERVSPHLASEGGFSPGDRVFHQKFGYGTVVTTDRDKLDINFEKAGRKKVMDSFVAKADD